MMPARRLPNGLLRPWAADLLAGLREQQRLRDRGLDLHLSHGEVAALGAALEGEAPGNYWTHAPVLTDEAGRILDQIGEHRTRTLALDQHELDHRLRQVHDHGRLREERVDLDQDHERVQLMGLDPAAPGPADADDPDTRRKHSLSPRPDILDHPELNGHGPGRVDTASAEQQQNRGKIDPIKQYLRDVPDPDDEEWTPS
jgi:hypothetical protein